MNLKGKYILIFICIVPIVAFFFSSCNKKIKPISKGKFSFSTDTLTFDTVFTQVGSATKQFLIYNNENKWLRIKNIALGRGESSPYRLNIDGQPTKNISDIDIAPNDSVWVFVAVTINPTATSNIFLETDSIVVQTEDYSNYIPLLSYAQNANYINDSVIKQNVIWTNDKPYVIINSCLIDSGYKLTIEKGTRIYMHASSKLYVLGSLETKGTVTDSVVFLGNRLDRDYFGGDIPGEWGGLYFHRLSKNNSLNYTVIKNCGLPTGIDGLNAAIYVDSSALSGVPLLTMNNCELGLSIGYGIFSYNGNIKATNCLIHTCGGNNIAAIKGGKLDFEFCTLTNYGYGLFLDHKNTPILALLNYFKYETNTATVIEGNDLYANFKNCIVYGNNIKGNEIAVDSFTNWVYQVNFQNCLVKQSDDISKYCTFNNVLANVDPKFKETSMLNFSLDPSSPAKLYGAPSSVVLDLKDNARGNPPSLGCYE